MIFPRHIQDAVIELLNNSEAGLNAQISDINLREGKTCPLANSIHKGVLEHDYPEVIVALAVSTPFEVNPDTDESTDDIAYSLPIDIIAYQKTLDPRIDEWKEIFGEAVILSINNKIILDSCRIKVRKFDRSPIPSDRSTETEETTTIGLDVYVNKSWEAL